jgi:hypothetical protein
MRIIEVTQAKVSKVTGNTAEIDHGDGTKTVVDLQKNPDALQKDQGTGRVTMNRNNQQKNNRPNNNQRVRPGDRVELPDEN